MSYLNVISLLGILGLCAIAWVFSEDRRLIPWRVIIWGIGLQLILGFLVFLFPPTKAALEWFSSLLNVIFDAADAGARFIFGRNIVPLPGQEPLILSPVGSNNLCLPGNTTPVLPGLCGIKLGYVFAFRALPTVIFFSGLMALLENLGIIQIFVNFFGWIFFHTMRLSGAEALSGSANIFVGIEAAIVVKPYLEKMTRSELCAILSCCFGTAASSTLAIYVGFLRPVFPNILGHLVSASIIAIPACFVLSKILVPETQTPLTMGGIPKAEKKRKPQDVDVLAQFDEDELDSDNDQAKLPELESVGGETMQRVSPLDAAIVGALEGVKMSVAIAAVLILILGLVYLVNQFFGFINSYLALINPVLGNITLANILGVLFYPLTLLTGVAVDLNKLSQGIPDDSWQAAVIIGRRLLETAIPPYQALAEAAKAGTISDRTVLIVSYALSGFAHLASVGIFVGGTIALIPSRRKDISSLGWKALFVGTLATMMIASISGVFYDPSNPSILGNKTENKTTPALPAASPGAIAVPVPTPTLSPEPAIVSPIPTVTPTVRVTPTPKPSASGTANKPKPKKPATKPTNQPTPTATSKPAPN